MLFNTSIGEMVMLYRGNSRNKNRSSFSHNNGAGVAQRLCNGLPCDDLGFDSRSERCINRASCPLQGTVNGGAVSK